MKITYIKGDLLDVTSGVIAHGCNAHGVMGSGVARGIRDKYPLAYNRYRDYCHLYTPRQTILGDVVWYHVNKNLHIANAITQLNYGRDNIRYVSYDAVDECFAGINAAMKDDLASELHIPMIGAGLGGGNWDIISSIIETNITNAKQINCWML